MMTTSGAIRGTGVRGITGRGVAVRWTAVGALVAAELTAVAVLIGLGSRPPFDLATDLDAWSRATPEDALAAALRWVALAVCAWLAFATVVDVVLALAGRRWACRVGRARRRVTPRVVRRLVDRAVVTGVAAGIAVAPGAAHAARDGGDARDARAPVVIVVRDGRGSLVSLPAATASRTAATPLTGPAPPPPTPAPTPAPPPALVTRPPTQVTVAPGDDLWEIAARAVAGARAVPRETVSDADVAGYWVRVCDANHATLVSGDLDLIHPGETIVLPPVS